MNSDQKKILEWYRENKRPLPWRKNRDPYRIWISEVMLQQTTVTAVIPYYEKFMESFPTVKKLASAPESQVIKHWAGLGYYSRARNLHKSAKILNETGFPRTYKELIQLPGFGPYTSRAVTSIAFDENVGVLDGNVIRVLSRKEGLIENPWWTSKGRQKLQELADQVVQDTPAHETNQALMELGATVCTPKKPSCLICPWLKPCQGQKKGLTEKIPQAKPKRAKEIWHWKVQLIQNRGRVALLPNDYTPFLKKQWIFPGTIQQKKTAPKKFDLRHSITHHDIYICVEKNTLTQLPRSQKKNCQWFQQENLSEVNPSSILKKVLGVTITQTLC